MFVVVLVHLLFLHSRGRDVSFLESGSRKRSKFWPEFVIKDGMNISWFVWFFVFMLTAPSLLSDAENFIAANQVVSPAHIQPE